MENIVKRLSRVEPVTTRPLSDIDGIAIHHSGDEGTPAIWARYHTTPPESGGPSWGPANSIGYHAAVLRNGESFKCAYDRDQTPGVANHNRHLLHVVCQGNLAKQSISAEQLMEMLRVCRRYMQAYSIPVERVRTHGEWADPDWATSCPGIPELGGHVRFLLAAGVDLLEGVRP